MKKMISITLLVLTKIEFIYLKYMKKKSSCLYNYIIKFKQIFEYVRQMLYNLFQKVEQEATVPNLI